MAHEWGTFTSVQGGDGALLPWRPLESSVLPGFVYNWKHPGLGRMAGGAMIFAKGEIACLQRMETPVIYFYSDERRKVDVSVDFPEGTITEWYPQAAKIGPAFPQNTNCTTTAMNESGARWSQVEILPQRANLTPEMKLPYDRSGSHYFAARETDASQLNITTGTSTSVPEREKFIFYRGTGNFKTPLKVTTAGENTVTIANESKEPLDHLFVLGLENGLGKFIHVERLAPGERRNVQLSLEERPVVLEKLSREVGREMASALTSQGLYQREANAMVETWRDSWFAEDGVRVLYLLPRTWTDRTLPLKLAPAPKDVVRVMVGRAEVLLPAREQQLAGAIEKAKQGDSAARAFVHAEFKSLARFAEPALQLAVKGADEKTRQEAWRLYQEALYPQPKVSVSAPASVAASPYE